MQDEPWRIERLWASTKRFKAELTRLGLRHRPLGDADHADHRRRLGGRDPVLRPAVRGGRLRDLGRLPDGRPRPGAPAHDRHRRAERRAPRSGARGVRAGRQRAGHHRRVTGERTFAEPCRRWRPVGLDRRGRHARIATSRSTPTSTPTSRRTARSRSTSTRPWPSSAASPRSRSPTTSTSTRATRPSSTPATRTASGSSAAPPSAGRSEGVVIRFGAELTYNRRWEDDVRAHLRATSLRLRHRVGPRLARVAVLAGRASGRGSTGPLARGDPRAVLRGDHRRGALRPVRHDRPPRRRQALPPPVRHGRRTSPPGRTSRSPRCGRSSSPDVSLEVNSSGLRYPGAETYPSGGRRRAVSRAGGRARGGRVRCPLTRLVRAPARTSRTGTSPPPDSRR